MHVPHYRSKEMLTLAYNLSFLWTRHYTQLYEVSFVIQRYDVIFLLDPALHSLSSHLIYPFIIIIISSFIIIIIFINSLTAKVVGAPQMISQPLSSIFPCSPLPSGTLQTPGLSFPWCCLPTSSSVCIVLFPPSLCLKRLFWPDLMNGRHDYTTAVCLSLPWSEGLRVIRLPAGSWHGLPRW